METPNPAPAGALPGSLQQWQAQLDQHMPHLSKPLRTVLCLWSFSISILQCTGLTTAATFIAGVIECKPSAARQRLREFYKETEAKAGKNRRDLDVCSCFLPMFRWALSKLSRNQTRLAVALDASTLASRFTVLAISVVYRGVAIPVVWTIVSATAKGAWKPHWLSMLEQLRGAVPEGLEVYALADRGLYAKWLFAAIKDLNWHPFMRINKDGLYTKASCQNWVPLSALIKPGESWRGKIRCFKGNPLSCTLLACWDARHKDPWLIVTDVDPETAKAVWYSQRSWIEGGFKDIKRGGFQWQNTRMEDPERAARLWLPIAVAMLLQIEAGTQAEEAQAAAPSPELPPTHISSVLYKGQKRKWLSLFRLGCIERLVQLVRGSFRLSDHTFPAFGFD